MYRTVLKYVLMAPEDAGEISGQSHIGGTVSSAAAAIEGLLDDDGHVNPSGTPSRALDPDGENEGSQARDQRGRFRKQQEDNAEGVDEEEFEDEGEDAGDSEDQETDDSETDDAESEDEEGEESATETESESGETDEIQSLSELAEALEIPLDQLKESLQHTFTASGEEMTVTLAELEKGYQRDADYRRKTSQIAEQSKKMEQDYALRHQQFEQQHRELATTMMAAEQLLVSDMDSPEMQTLRQTDPAEWAARKEELNNRLRTLQSYRSQAMQQYEAQNQQFMMAKKAAEMQSLQSKVEGFGEEHVTKASEVITSLGYSPEEAAQIMDHRIVLGALELADLRAEVEKLRNQVAKGEKAVKKVRKNVPKMTSKGGKQSPKPLRVKSEKLSKLRRKAKQSGRVEDAAKVIESML